MKLWISHPVARKIASDRVFVKRAVEGDATARCEVLGFLAELADQLRHHRKGRGKKTRTIKPAVPPTRRDSEMYFEQVAKIVDVITELLKV